MSRPLWLALLLATAFLAGCFGGDVGGDTDGTDGADGTDGSSDGSDGGDGDDGDDDHDGGGGDAGTDNGTGANSPPEPVMTASIQQGQIPFNVTFDLTATDPDGDTLTWTLDADGDGTMDAEGDALPANHTHTFTEEGEFNATFTVDDGTEAVSVSLVVNATEAAAGDPGFETIVITGTISGLWAPEVGYLTDPNAHPFDVPGVAGKMTADLTWDEQTVDLDMAVYTPDGTEAGSAANFNEPTGQVPDFNPPGEQIVVEDPAHLSQVGTWNVEVYAASAAQGSYTVTITFEA